MQNFSSPEFMGLEHKLDLQQNAEHRIIRLKKSNLKKKSYCWRGKREFGTCQCPLTTGHDVEYNMNIDNNSPVSVELSCCMVLMLELIKVFFLIWKENDLTCLSKFEKI